MIKAARLFYLLIKIQFECFQDQIILRNPICSSLNFYRNETSHLTASDSLISIPISVKYYYYKFTIEEDITGLSFFLQTPPVERKFTYVLFMYTYIRSHMSMFVYAYIHTYHKHTHM